MKRENTYKQEALQEWLHGNRDRVVFLGGDGIWYRYAQRAGVLA